MALKMSITSSAGVEVSSAYIKVDEYSCQKDNTINARIRAYASQALEAQGASALEGSEDIVSFGADYADDAVNTKKQIYEHLKSLDKYKEAVDVLE